MDAKPRLHTTADGSHSLYSNRFQQYYHNPNGAVSESLHVFFEHSGLIERLRSHKPVSIFETGFGTGLNLALLLDLIEKEKSQSDVSFESVEAWPITEKEAAQLNFGTFLERKNTMDLLLDIFSQLENGKRAEQTSGKVKVVVHKCRFDEVEHLCTPYTNIFHDPFSPEVNSELWTPEVFQTLRTHSKHDAILSTYCAAVSARAAMAKAGWHPAKAPGALGKREMTLASPKAEILTGYKLLNTQRLISRWNSGDFL